MKDIPPSPVQARHAEISMVFSADDDTGPSKRLLDIAVEAAAAARTIDLSDLSKRMGSPPFFVDVWPGEHYKLLGALVTVLNPKTVVEIGTATGLSALSMKKYLSSDAVLATFDIIPWPSVRGSVLRDEDFSDGQLVQYTENLEEVSALLLHRELLEKSDLIFVDAAKDGVLEERFIQNLRRIEFKTPPIVVFDDIRLWNMLKIWRDIRAPKLDITSFGHWSGTGLVDWRWPL